MRLFRRRKAKKEHSARNMHKKTDVSDSKAEPARRMQPKRPAPRSVKDIQGSLQLANMDLMMAQRSGNQKMVEYSEERIRELHNELDEAQKLE